MFRVVPSGVLFYIAFTVSGGFVDGLLVVLGSLCFKLCCRVGII